MRHDAGYALLHACGLFIGVFWCPLGDIDIRGDVVCAGWMDGGQVPSKIGGGRGTGVGYAQVHTRGIFFACYGVRWVM